MAEQKARVIKPMNAQVVPGHCGSVVRYIPAREGEPANIDCVTIMEAQEHMHERSTEYYFVLGGRGRIYLDGKAQDIYDRHLVVIPPGVWHMAEKTSQGRLEILVVGVPPVMPDDIHFREDEHA